MITMLDAILIAIVASAILTVVTYPKRRARIEATCIKESRLKTFADEFIVNFFLSMLLVCVIVVTYIITGVFE